MAARLWDAVAECGGGSGSLRTLNLYGFIEGIEGPIAAQRFLMDVIGPLKTIERLELSYSTLIYPLRRNTNNDQQQGQEPVRFLNIKILHFIETTEGYTHPRYKSFISNTPTPPTPIQPSAQLQLMCLCPNLENISLTNHKTTLPLDQISKALTARTWPLLKSLALLDMEYTDQEMSHILLNAFRDAQLESLSLHGCLFGDASLAAFESRMLFERIRRLGIVRTEYDSSMRISRIVQRILEICPRLESFEADTNLARDIVNGQEWACKGCLRKWKAEIDLGHDQDSPSEGTTISSDEDGLSPRTRRQRALYRRLNTLHNLQELDLRHDLDMLSGLRNLQKLYFVQWQRMTMEDLEWMRKHWPRFSEITQRLHDIDDEERNKVLNHARWNFGWSIRP